MCLFKFKKQYRAVLEKYGRGEELTREELTVFCIGWMRGYGITDEAFKRIIKETKDSALHSQDTYNGMRLYRLRNETEVLVDTVEKYVREECPQSELLAVNDKIKKYLEIWSTSE